VKYDNNREVHLTEVGYNVYLYCRRRKYGKAQRLSHTIPIWRYRYYIVVYYYYDIIMFYIHIICDSDLTIHNYLHMTATTANDLWNIFTPVYI